MKKGLFVLLLLLITNSAIYSNDKIFFADITGNKNKERIILKCDSKNIIKSLIIQSNGKEIYKNNNMGYLPFVYAKIVKFEGISKGSERDLFFIVVGECDAYLHVLSYETTILSDGGANEKNFILKKNVAQIESCY